MDGAHEKCTVKTFQSENLKGRDSFGVRGVDSRIILKWILQIRCDDATWIQKARDRVQWRDLVNTLMNLQFPRKARDVLSIWANNSFSKKGSAQLSSKLNDFGPYRKFFGGKRGKQVRKWAYTVTILAGSPEFDLCPLFLSDLNQNWNVSTDFSKTSQYKISWISVQWFPSCYIRSDE
jgi:hypothetical protein